MRGELGPSSSVARDGAVGGRFLAEPGHSCGFAPTPTTRYETAASSPPTSTTTTRIGAPNYEDSSEIMFYRDTLRRIQVQARTPEETRTLLFRRIEELT